MKGVLGYYYHCGGHKGGNPDGIPLVSEFEDVFRALQGITPDMTDLFIAELEPGTAPMSKSPYCLAPAEMAELKSIKFSEG